MLNLKNALTVVMAFIVWLCAAPAATAQTSNIDPRFPVLGKSVFGVGTFYGTHSALPGQAALNPAAETLILDTQMPPSFELDFGTLETRSDFTLNMGIANLITPLSKRATMRLSGYSSWSNAKPIPVTEPASIEHDGSAVELSFAYRFNRNLDLGVAFVPHDRMETTLSLGNATLATGSAESNFQARLGAFWRTNDQKLKVGIVYNHDAIEAESSSVTRPKRWKGSFLQRSWTAGASYDVRPGTTIFYNRQEYNLKGEGLNINRPSSYWGVQQFLSPKLMLRYARATSGNEISVGYVGKKWEGYISYNDRAFAPADDSYGRSSLVFASVIRKF